MDKLLSRRPSASMVVAVVALIVAASATAVAAGLVNGDKLIKKDSLSGNRLRNHSVTAKQINSTSLGLFSSGLVQLDPAVGTTTQRILITDGPLRIVGVCSVDGTGHAVGDVLIASSSTNTTWSNGNNGNFTIGPSTPASLRTILAVGPALFQGYVAGKSFGAVAASGKTLNGLVSAGLHVPAPGGPQPCLFHVDAFG